MINKISILGAGAFGFAIAKVIGENHPNKDIFLFDVNNDFIKAIKKTREHPVFFNDFKLPDNIYATNKLKETIADADLVILAIPSKFIREMTAKYKKYLKKKVIILSLIKGLEVDTNKRVSEIIQDILGSKFDYEYAVLSGGMIAKDVVAKNPLCANIASKNRDTAKSIAKILYNDYIRIETTDDVLGVELAGAFKNVISIGAGFIEGMGHSESSRAAYVSTAAKEMQTLAITIGARRETFGTGSQAWFGDLMTTCFGESRNREFGSLIGQGVKIKEALKIMEENHKSVEGYPTTKVVYKLIKKYKIDAPVLENVYKIVYKKESAKTFVSMFITH